MHVILYIWQLNIPVYNSLSTNCITSKSMRWRIVIIIIVITTTIKPSYDMMRNCATALEEIAHAQQAQRTLLLLCGIMTAGWILTAGALQD